MFKYHILIKFTNVIPTLKKKIPFFEAPSMCDASRGFSLFIPTNVIK